MYYDPHGSCCIKLNINCNSQGSSQSKSRIPAVAMVVTIEIKLYATGPWRASLCYWALYIWNPSISTGTLVTSSKQEEVWLSFLTSLSGSQESPEQSNGNQEDYFLHSVLSGWRLVRTERKFGSGPIPSSGQDRCDDELGNGWPRSTPIPIQLHWASKETYHFFRATPTKIHAIKINNICTQISFNTP